MIWKLFGWYGNFPDKNDKYLPHLFTKENSTTGADFLVKVVTKNYKCLPHLFAKKKLRIFRTTCLLPTGADFLALCAVLEVMRVSE